MTRSFVNLGHQPPSNAYLTKEQLELPEVTYPLHAFVCENCWLVQLPAHASASELFTDTYAYFSSVSSTWVEHARQYVAMVIPRFKLDGESLVVEIASNDGYLLQFVNQAGIPCVGVEPTASTATAARAKNIESIEEFFGCDFADQFVKDRCQADLILGNNVLAHVPDLLDFVGGVVKLLKPDGVATFEFPHLKRLIEGLQFDTIYHEHYSYFSFNAACQLFEKLGLRIFDVEELSTHGGSLRIFASHRDSHHSETAKVAELLKRERSAGMATADYYAGFQPRVDDCKNGLLEFLLKQKRDGKLVAGYGAAAKGNTLLNYAGVRSDLIPFVCDAAPSKQGNFLPGSHIPIVAPSQLESHQPMTVLILPWNIAKEVTSSNSDVASWGGIFATAIPELALLSP